MTSNAAMAPSAVLIATRRSFAALGCDQKWIGLPVTAIAASFIASECVGWA